MHQKWFMCVKRNISKSIHVMTELYVYRGFVIFCMCFFGPLNIEWLSLVNTYLGSDLTDKAIFAHAHCLDQTVLWQWCGCRRTNATKHSTTISTMMSASECGESLDARHATRSLFVRYPSGRLNAGRSLAITATKGSHVGRIRRCGWLSGRRGSRSMWSGRTTASRTRRPTNRHRYGWCSLSATRRSLHIVWRQIHSLVAVRRLFAKTSSSWTNTACAQSWSVLVGWLKASASLLPPIADTFVETGTKDWVRILCVRLFCCRVNALIGSLTLLTMNDDILFTGTELKKIVYAVRILGLHSGRNFNFVCRRRRYVHEKDTAQNLTQVRGEVGLKLIRNASNANEKAVNKVFRDSE